MPMMFLAHSQAHSYNSSFSSCPDDKNDTYGAARGCLRNLTSVLALGNPPPLVGHRALCCNFSTRRDSDLQSFIKNSSPTLKMGKLRPGEGKDIRHKVTCSLT